MTDNQHTPLTDFSEDATAYALGAMDCTERANFERTATEQDWAEVSRAQDVASELGRVAPVAPPPHLKARLLQQIKNTPQETAARMAPVSPAHASEGLHGDQSAPEAPADNVINPFEPRASAAHPHSPAQTKARARWSKPLASLAVVSAAAALVAAGWGYSQHQQLEQARSEIVAMQQAQDSSLVDQISQASDVSLAKGNMDGSNISVVYSPSHNMASIATNDLPALPQGKAYMIWLYDAQGNIVGSGTLNNGSLGSVLTEMTNQDLSNVTDFGITVEDSTATAPSEKPMMLDVMDN